MFLVPSVMTVDCHYSLTLYLSSHLRGVLLQFQILTQVFLILRITYIFLVI
jgi:hypothetical protein